MKKKKVLPLMLAAVMTVGCCFTAYADDDDEHIEHYEYYYDKDGNPVTGLYYGYISWTDKGMDYGDDNYEGYNERMSYMKKFFSDGQFDGLYTGFTEDSGGKRYYCNGRRVCGWYKTKEGWRHFDGDGYMSTGKTGICGTNYYFDDDGVWTGKFGKNGKAPEDFSVSIEERNLGGFDSGTLKIFYPEAFTYDDDGETLFGSTSQDIKISARDRQALYCMFLESGFADVELPEKMGKEYLQDFMDEHNKDGKYYFTSADDEYTLTVAAGGKTYSVEYSGCLIGQIASGDRAAGAVTALSDGLNYYLASLKEKFPQNFASEDPQEAAE